MLVRKHGFNKFFFQEFIENRGLHHFQIRVFAINKAIHYICRL